MDLYFSETPSKFSSMEHECSGSNFGSTTIFINFQVGRNIQNFNLTDHRIKTKIIGIEQTSRSNVVEKHFFECYRTCGILKKNGIELTSRFKKKRKKAIKAVGQVGL